MTFGARSSRAFAMTAQPSLKSLTSPARGCECRKEREGEDGGESKVRRSIRAGGEEEAHLGTCLWCNEGQYGSWWREGGMDALSVW